MLLQIDDYLTELLGHKVDLIRKGPHLTPRFLNALEKTLPMSDILQSRLETMLQALELIAHRMTNIKKADDLAGKLLIEAHHRLTAWNHFSPR